MPFLKVFLITLTVFLFSVNLPAQQKRIVSSTRIMKQDERVVYDSTGKELPYSVWKILTQSGDFALRRNGNGSFQLYRLSEEQKEFRDSIILSIPPPQSTAFSRGQKMYRIKTTDIYGNKVNTEELKGKIIVLNFWFINCPPCRSEIPELNRLVEAYQKDSSIVFIGIALDELQDIADFLAECPFNYIMIGNGKKLKRSYDVKNFPTNVVIDRQGKVYYHCMGYSPSTTVWLKKAIDEIREMPVVFNKSINENTSIFRTVAL